MTMRPAKMGTEQNAPKYVRQGHDHEGSNAIPATPLHDIGAGLTMIPVVEWTRLRKRNGMWFVRPVLTVIRVKSVRVKRQQPQNLSEHVLVAHGSQSVPIRRRLDALAGGVTWGALTKKLNRFLQGSDPTISDPR